LLDLNFNLNRGNIGVIIFNHHRNKDFAIFKGERIAQLIFEKIETPILVEHSVADLNQTTLRGNNGFGWTGKGGGKEDEEEVFKDECQCNALI